MLKLIAAAALLGATPAAAEVVTKPSPHTVDVTADRLAAAAGDAGATVVARVDHAAAAEGAGMVIPGATLLIFGDPQVGTPVMQEDLRAGLVLPLRVLVHEADGSASAVTYQTASDLFAGLDVDPSGEAAARIDGALDNLTNSAVAD
ncbi:DUF302 domain-containing protein [Jannaschia sp. LMIT008]|uniref:DUF302 domain-containing protein n=1 Tax=Jannaschia maritima TaxID=3032585 RepID=UPI0028117545|nr:DUF302 domain-containing protein [Jannaschia sp. LMIT008]